VMGESLTMWIGGLLMSLYFSDEFGNSMKSWGGVFM
jgi:hypothetical protein